MRKTNKLALVAIFIPSIILSQQSHQKRSLALSISPAIVLTPNSQLGIQPGFKYRISGHFLFSTDFAFTLGKRYFDSLTLHRQFFRIQPSIRYDLSKSAKDIKIYFGLQGSYSFRKFENLVGGSFVAANGDSTYSFDAATIKSPIFTSTIQIGSEVFLNNISIEVSYGAGVRIINTSYTNLINAIPHEYYPPGSPDRVGPIPAEWYSGTLIRTQLNVIIRFCYYIK
jgi:hypothetical protein